MVFNKNTPPFRSETKEAILQIAEKLNLPYSGIMQDWAYEVADRNHIQTYIDYYQATAEWDVKFVLIQMILQALEEQPEETFPAYSCIVTTLLTKDFYHHQYTIYYWAMPDEDVSDADTWRITPLMRQIWFKNSTCFRK
ncbi:MAG: hypothetical protein LUG18_09370 [Candidatus Azobacteroides sp.]|nr:hypothetical protein [Candidatus Azobacteroides sp.]